MVSIKRKYKPLQKSRYSPSFVKEIIFLKVFQKKSRRQLGVNHYTGGSHLSWIFWEHENLPGLNVIQLIHYNKFYYTRKFGKTIWAKRESSLTVVCLKQDSPV